MAHQRSKGTVAVVGAGLTGSCTGLALADAGFDVTLVEQDPVAMNRASLRNEGKIHLGFVYANDRTLATAQLMLRGALSFRSILRHLTGPAFDSVGISTPFHYVLACDSFADIYALTRHFESIQDAYDALANDGADYLGKRPCCLFRLLPERDWDKWYASSVVSAVFDTEEVAIDGDNLAFVIRRALDASPRVKLRTLHKVMRVETCSGGYLLRGTKPDGEWRLQVDQVVNCTWEQRNVLDQQMGIEASKDLLHRLKYRLIVELPQELRRSPSATMVLGKYGDVVVRPNGTGYLSWYPAGLQGWSNEAIPPASWDRACRGEVEAVNRERFIKETFAGLGAWYRAIEKARPILVDAGAIVALGRTDVDDPASRLHERIHVGVESVDGYHTVDPGKLTTAPLFSLEAADRVMAASAGRTVGQPSRLTTSGDRRSVPIGGSR